MCSYIVGVSSRVGVVGFGCLCGSWRMSVWCVCGGVSCFGFGLKCPCMRGGDVVGDQGGGCW